MDHLEVDKPISQVVIDLCEVTSRQLVAVISQVSDGATITDWQNGTVQPKIGQKMRLLTLYNIVEFLREKVDDSSIHMFLTGMNPTLDDRTPALTIRDGDFAEAWAAAKNFASDAFN